MKIEHRRPQEICSKPEEIQDMMREGGKESESTGRGSGWHGFIVACSYLQPAGWETRRSRRESTNQSCSSKKSTLIHEITRESSPESDLGSFKIG